MTRISRGGVCPAITGCVVGSEAAVVGAVELLAGSVGAGCASTIGGGGGGVSGAGGGVVVAGITGSGGGAGIACGVDADGCVAEDDCSVICIANVREPVIKSATVKIAKR